MYIKKIKKNSLKYFLPIIFAACFLFFSCSSASAATLSISSNSASVASGSTIRFSILINSGGVAINNASASISFPTDKLEVVSISKGSVFSLWAEEPTTSKSAGVITFNGGVPTPGYSGSGGTVISINARAKAVGQASLSFSSASILANDGLGTNVLSGTTGRTITITEKPPAVEETPAPTPEPTPEPAPEPEPEPAEPTTPVENPTLIQSIMAEVLSVFTRESFTVKTISFWILILLSSLGLILGVFIITRYSRRLGNKFMIRTGLNKGDSLKILLLYKKLLEENLGVLQETRRDRILTKQEKGIKKTIEDDLDQVDRAIAVQKTKEKKNIKKNVKDNLDKIDKIEEWEEMVEEKLTKKDKTDQILKEHKPKEEITAKE